MSKEKEKKQVVTVEVTAKNSDKCLFRREMVHTYFELSEPLDFTSNIVHALQLLYQAVDPVITIKVILL